MAKRNDTGSAAPSPLEEPADLPSSSKYWRGMSGFTYQKMIADRESGGQKAYRQQEVFLSSFAKGEQKRLGRELSMLEFGCGFGRHSWYLSGLPEVRYSGYDFSEEMVSPLRHNAPQGLEPLAEHLFVGPSLEQAVEGRSFDVVFTVSVLIHNPPERLPALIQSLARLLKPGGAICLIENQLVPFGVYENNWHQGCWLHRYLDAVPNGWEAQVGHGQIDTHDIYILRPGTLPKRRLVLFRGAYPESSQETSEEGLDRLGLPKLAEWARKAEDIIQAPQHVDPNKSYEQGEFLNAEREQLARRRRLLSIVEDLAAVRRQQVATRDWVHSNSEQTPEVLAPNVLFDAPLDTQWATKDLRFGRVLQLFHLEWHGIRALSGYLPGHKLAIAGEREMSPDDFKLALECCVSGLAKVVVLHAYSENAERFVRLLRRNLGSSLKIFGVWHGSTAQFHLDFEFDAFARMLAMRQEGLLDGLGSVKPDLDLLHPSLFPKTLLNLPPDFGPAASRSSAGLQGQVLVPLANDWRKNFYTNLYAAMGVSRVRSVYVTAPYRQQPAFPATARVISVPRPQRNEVFRLLREMDLSLNATLSECQPMTAVESLPLGVPCITGPLSLGELDQHPYQRAVQIAGVDSVGEVRRAIERLLDLKERSPGELSEMMRDYASLLTARSLDLYGEFLGL